MRSSQVFCSVERGERREEREMSKTIYLNLTDVPEDRDLQFKWWVEGVLLTAVALPGILGNLIT